MLVSPAAIVASRPSLGFSAAMRKDWNTFCSMNAVVNPTTIRPYSTLSAIIASVAPKKRATGSIAAMPTAVSSTPSSSVRNTIIEK